MSKSMQVFLFILFAILIFIADIVIIILTKTWFRHPQAIPILGLQAIVSAATIVLLLKGKPDRGCVIFVLNGLSIILLIFLAYVVGAF